MFSLGPGPNAVKFSGGLPETATFLYRGPGGCLLIELDDHSPRAESSFGNDVAFLIHVAVEHKPQMLTLLRGKQQRPPIGGDLELFEIMRDRFCDFYETQRWLDANGIPYRKEFDSKV